MTPEHTGEASYRYGDTYVKAVIDGDAHVVRVLESTGRNSLLVYSEDIGEASVLMEDIDFSYPDLGYINTPTTSFYMSRLPDNFINGGRVYKRGWRRDECTAVSIGAGRSPSLNQIFYPRYPSWEEARSIITDTPSEMQAFSPSFALAKYEERPYPVLFYHAELVGYVKDNVFILPDEYDYIADELREFNEAINVEIMTHGT